MKRFCYSLDDGDIRFGMLNSVYGEGAFRSFKDNLLRYDLEDAWHEFRYSALRELAVDWCEENDLKYE